MFPYFPWFCVYQCFTFLQAFKEIDASLQKLWLENQKCDAADGNDINDSDDRDMIPVCMPCFTGDAKTGPNHLSSIDSSAVGKMITENNRPMIQIANILI